MKHHNRSGIRTPPSSPIDTSLPPLPEVPEPPNPFAAPELPPPSSTATQFSVNTDDDLGDVSEASAYSSETDVEPGRLRARSNSSRSSSEITLSSPVPLSDGEAEGNGGLTKESGAFNSASTIKLEDWRTVNKQPGKANAPSMKVASQVDLPEGGESNGETSRQEQEESPAMRVRGGCLCLPCPFTVSR